VGTQFAPSTYGAFYEPIMCALACMKNNYPGFSLLTAHCSLKKRRARLTRHIDATPNHWPLAADNWQLITDN
jgi:hypothetical protein